MDEVAFKFEKYKFTKASLNFNIPGNATFDIGFMPKGTLFQNEGRFELAFDTLIECKETNTPVIAVSCEASFIFTNNVTKEDIPNYFYPNSLAIIFPYIRAFVSTLSLQANIPPVILPTINLMGITDELRNKTIVKE